MRKALRRKTALNAVTKENARLHRTVRRLLRRTETQETVIAKLRATRAVPSKALHGRRREKRKRPGTGRPRGQVRGAPGHGRTPRSGLEERVEEHNPPEEARMCTGCGKPCAAVGAEQSALVEIEVKAHRRVIRRGHRRRMCGCVASPVEVSAPPVPRLFPNTSFGVSVWSRFLYERYACLRPVQRIGAWLSDQGLPAAAGTLADSVPRFVPLFEPLGESILAHQTAAALRHADKTGWRVRAQLLDGLVILQFYWVHQRRDFIQCAAGQVDLTGWCGAWLERIAAIYRLTQARLAHYGPGAESKGTAFDAAQHALETALDGLFAKAERELAGLSGDAPEGKALRSLVNHREGLTVFVDRPRVPLDNNVAVYRASGWIHVGATQGRGRYDTKLMGDRLLNRAAPVSADSLSRRSTARAVRRVPARSSDVRLSRRSI